MIKSKFKFVFPKISKEYEAMANSMHIEPAAAMALYEEKTDLCMVYYADTLQFFCRYDKDDKDKHFKYYYEDKSKPREIHIICDAEIVECYRSEGCDVEAAKTAVAQYGVFPDYLKERTFRTEEEVNAYTMGYTDAMEMTDHMDDFAFLSEEEYFIFWEASNRD